MDLLIDTAQVGERLKQERERLGLSQERCSELTAITRPSQSRYETGASTPGLDYLARLGGLGFDVMFVIFGKRTSSFMEVTSPIILNEAIDLIDELAVRHDMTLPPAFRIKAIIWAYHRLMNGGGHAQPPTMHDLLTAVDVGEK
ncbi:helix-turn-helix domain-containing protein [Curvibacter lanceolatus]|uniref:helix-turn-helix domain-containing protein n=1 Tax=Curvibacter lanceolatus TaxID=86182 RepID=UPI00037FBDB8|nr:helix-turn-helix transcriptional regulator [Curvibacter lanceolatus]